MTILAVKNSPADFIEGNFTSFVVAETLTARYAPYLSEAARFTTERGKCEFAESSSFWVSFYAYIADTGWFTGDYIFELFLGSTSLFRFNATVNEEITFQYKNSSNNFVTFGSAVGGTQNTLVRWDLQFVLAASGGAIRVYREGSLVAELTGNTSLGSVGITTADNLLIGAHTVTTNVTISALIVSTTDTRQMFVNQLPVNAAGSNSGFTGSVADVDELGMPNDNDFLSSTTLGVTSTFNAGNHNSFFNTGYTVEAVVVTARALGEPDKYLRPVVLSGGTLGEGIGTQLDLSRSPLQHVFSTDPATGIGWTLSGVNAAEVGVKLADSA